MKDELGWIETQKGVVLGIGEAAADSSVASSPTAHRAIPWGQRLRLPAGWAIIVSHFASNWGLYVLLAWPPS